jgi:CelD/BcsL family acetyltransferase involved in cellulose biosynthesis
MTMDLALEPLRIGSFLDEWDILARTSSSGIFATAEWHLAVQGGFADRGRPLVGAIREDGRLRGVAPFRFRERFLFRDAAFLGMGEGGYGLADYAGLLAAPGTERDVAEAVVAWLRARGDWDVLDLQQLPEGPLTDTLLSAISQTGLRSLVRRQNICHVIALPSTWSEYRARLSSGTRDWLERKPRKAERELGAQVELVEPDRMLEEYTTMRRFQSERFGGQPEESERRLTSVISAWLPLAYERGWLRMFRLRSGSRTIGVLLGYEYENAFYFHSAAFESQPDRSGYSLGASLLSSALRWSVEHGLKRFDMLRGNYNYKGRLGTEQRSNYRVLAFRQSPRGRALEALIVMRSRLKGQPPWADVAGLTGEELSRSQVSGVAPPAAAAGGRRGMS